MANSNNLNITPMAVGQSSKEATHNTAIQALEDAANVKLAVDMSGGNVTLTVAQLTRHYLFVCSGQTASRDLITPHEVNSGTPLNRAFAVRNDSSTYNVVVKNATGATVSVPPGHVALLLNDGTDIKALSLQVAVPTIDLGFFWRGVTTNGVLMAQYVARRPFTIPAALAGSVAFQGVNTTADAVLHLRKNGGSDFGTITFHSGGTYTLAAATATAFAVNDALQIIGPTTADATMADISWTLAALLG